jgi:hypothetical protein
VSAIKSIASLVTTRQDRKTALCSLIELNADGELNLDTAAPRAFQYYPETISDSKGVDYKSKDITGGSHPIYQWINSGARRISFEATFSSEEAPPFDGGFVSNLAQSVQNIGATVSGIVKNPVAAAIGAIKGKDSSARWSVDVAAAIAWLRSMTYPVYARNNRVSLPPPKLLLVLPNSGITSGVGGGQATPDGTVPVIMTDCSVTYEAFFRTGHPRVATVALEFLEIIQVGKSWGFVSRDRIFGQNARHSYNTYVLEDRNYPAQSANFRSTPNSGLSRAVGRIKQIV